MSVGQHGKIESPFVHRSKKRFQSGHVLIARIRHEKYAIDVRHRAGLEFRIENETDQILVFGSYGGQEFVIQIVLPQFFGEKLRKS